MSGFLVLELACGHSEALVVEVDEVLIESSPGNEWPCSECAGEPREIVERGYRAHGSGA